MTSCDVDTVRAVVAHIDEQLANRNDVAFQMDDWYLPLDARHLVDLRPEVAHDPDIKTHLSLEDKDECGTSMCFAGWALHYKGETEFLKRCRGVSDWEVAERGAQILGITNDNIFYDERISNTSELRAACNYYFKQEIFTPEECGDSVAWRDYD